MELKVVRIEKPDEVNLILGQSHFIKTVEDIHETIASQVPGAKFGLAFCESSGPALVRWSGTDPELTKLARENALALAAGHLFIILMRDFSPINVLNAIKLVPEVCRIYCATANPVEVIPEEDRLRAVASPVPIGSPFAYPSARHRYIVQAVAGDSR
jgi:hypothetical protein